MKTHNIVAAVMLLLVSLPVFAKGRIERIVITGPGLDKPVEVSDPAILQKLNPWFGKFSGDKGQAPAPKADDSTYEVLFYMRWPQRHSEFDLGELKLIYHVTYHPGADAETGRIYFPGSNDKYHVNAGTILRDGIDGTWQWASDGWEETMRQLKIISKPPNPATTAVSSLTRSIFYKTLRLVILGLVVLTIFSGLAWRRFVIANSYLLRNPIVLNGLANCSNPESVRKSLQTTLKAFVNFSPGLRFGNPGINRTNKSSRNPEGVAPTDEISTISPTYSRALTTFGKEF